MKTAYFSAAVALLLLAGCAASSAEYAPKTHKPAAQAADNTARFQCDNGKTVFVNYQSSDRIVVGYELGNGSMDIVPLNAAPAASGTLYVSADRSTEWHEKNGEAVFQAPQNGKNVTTFCRKAG